MNEEAVSFGNDQRLVGVISAPAGADSGRDRPAVLLLNAGLLHRVGPYRLYVDLARSLVKLGFVVLRFDLSGLGDSLHGDDTKLYDDRVFESIQRAMDLLTEKHGIDKCVLMGLCAGADNAHKAAVRDDRVTGAVFFDGYGYRTWGYYLYHYGPKLLNPRKYRNFLQDKLASAGFGNTAQSAKRIPSDNIFVRRFPPKQQVEREIQALIDRDVRLMYVFTGGLRYSYYNHRNQINAMFRSVDFKGKVQTEYFDRAEHTFPSMAEREALISSVCQWMNAQYGPAAVANSLSPVSS